MREADERYFAGLESQLETALEIAEHARRQGKDPEPEVEIPVAADMADRVENILGIPGVAERVRELEGEMSREAAALELARDFAEGTVGEYDTRAGKIEGAIRTAVALLTEGVVAAPIEGIDGVEIRPNDDGTEFVRVFYAGPIRSAGGTAQALSVLVADYARTLLGIDSYHPREAEIERYAEEVELYDDDTGLQYTPKKAETRFIAEHCPVMLDGEATSDDAVSGYRDLERVDTNRARGGMCLVLAEGIAQKAPKIKRYTDQLDDVDWPWLDALIEGTYAPEAKADGGVESGADADTDADVTSTDGPAESPATPPAPAGDEGSRDGPPRPAPDGKYLRDLIAGRPVFAHPSEPGGFRLRYGRARNHGFATAGVHPATMRLVDDFLATGTQLKTERPGKAAGVVPVDSIEGPTVRLADGSVRRIDDPAEAKELRNGVDAILDLGEYLVNYGEFVENNHDLVPAAYTVEWWRQDLAAAGADVRAFVDDPRLDLDAPGFDRALRWATEFDAPLHPRYTYCWHDLDREAFLALADAVADGRVQDGRLHLDRREPVRTALEALLVEHDQRESALVVDAPHWRALVRSLGFEEDLTRDWTPEEVPATEEWPHALRAVNAVAPFEVRQRAPTRVGSRMGRPEKSEVRELNPAVHTLFPIGEAGGDQRDVGAAAEYAEGMNDRPGQLRAQVGRRVCPACGTDTYRPSCPECAAHTELAYACPDCEIEATETDGGYECPRCGADASPVEDRSIDLHAEYRRALEAVGERENAFEILKGVKGLSSAVKTPEPLEKGILRAKHGVSSFKDGTVRYDMTDLPVTSVRPAELDVSVERLRELGYETDIHGEPLRYDDQLVELRVQDVVLSSGAADHLLKVADFVDDLLVNFYDMEPFYEVDDREDLIGELVFGLAPHTSAAVTGRIIGFTDAAVGYAHPYFHAAKRRNCFHPETDIWVEDDAGGCRSVSIESFVEQRLEAPRTDDFGTLIEELDGELRVPSLDSDGSYVRKPVEAVSKHPAPDHLIKIETEVGRKLTVTPDHSMARWDDGLERVRASEIEVGDKVPAPNISDVGELKNERKLTADGGSPRVQVVEQVQIVPSDVDCTYSLTVADTHNVIANKLSSFQCDGDEDCVMLLMDGLLNFSMKYLPDQRGGSVAEDSRLVAVDPSGDVRFLTFDDLWDELETPTTRDGKFRKKPCLTEGWRTYAFDRNHEASLRPIEKAIRYEADDEEELVRVETQFGRSLEITEHHSLFRYDDGIEEVAGEELTEGDLILAPRQLDIDPTERTIDVTECLDDPYVVIDDDVEHYLRSAWNAADCGDTVRQAFQNGLAYRLARRKISYERFCRLVDRSTVEPPPDDLRIATPRGNDGIRPEIEVDEGFAWLLGLFVAEGSLSGGSVTIYNADEDLIERAESLIESILGTAPSVRWSNKAYELRLPTAFRDVLYEIGFKKHDHYNSSEKVVPECILDAPRDVVIAFLRGFILGDGSDSSNDNVTTVAFHTTSEDVKDGIVFLLHRLGIVSNVSYRDDRSGNRQPIYTVTVSGGANDNPLHRVLHNEEPYLPKSLVVRIPDPLMAIREMEIKDVKQIIPKYLLRRENVSLEKLREMIAELGERDLPDEAKEQLEKIRPLVDGDLSYLRVTSVERVDYDGYLYDLQVGGDPVFTANWLYAHNSMDAPLVMSSRIDPTEIDDEAHNVDIVAEYPRSFYEVTMEMADPDAVDITIAEDTLETDDQYRGFRHTHDTGDIAAGPSLSAYKTLGSMGEKLDAQLELARKLRGVDETDVAERIIEYHFLPDLLGNLRAFARQETRCLDCGTKYRRPPLSGDCRECGGDMTLTVHEGSVNKYLDTAIRVAEEYGAEAYTKQRLRIIERSLESLFEDDTNKQGSIADFM